MNKTRFTTAALFVCVVAFVVGCSTMPNLLENGNVEPQSPDETSPADWYATQLDQTKDFVHFTWDDQVVHRGSRSISIAIDASHPDEQVHYNWTKVVPDCQPGHSYKLTGWVKTEDLQTSAWIVVQFWNKANDKMLGIASTEKDCPVTGTSDWTRVTLEFTVPEGTAEVRVRAGMSTPENRGGRVWFDDIRVCGEH